MKPTSERWDLYDKDYKKIEGAGMLRGEPIPAGRFHLVGNVLVRHADGTYLLMLRDRFLQVVVLLWALSFAVIIYL